MRPPPAHPMRGARRRGAGRGVGSAGIVVFGDGRLHRADRYGCHAGAGRGGQRGGGIRRCAGDDETAPALPAVSTAAVSTPVTEGAAAAFVLRRTGAVTEVAQREAAPRSEGRDFDRLEPSLPRPISPNPRIRVMRGRLTTPVGPIRRIGEPRGRIYVGSSIPDEHRGQCRRLELIRIRGHLTLWGGGIHHAEIKTAVRAGVPAPDG